jgi:hypothetical protein
MRNLKDFTKIRGIWRYGSEWCQGELNEDPCVCICANRFEPNSRKKLRADHQPPKCITAWTPDFGKRRLSCGTALAGSLKYCETLRRWHHSWIHPVWDECRHMEEGRRIRKGPIRGRCISNSLEPFRGWNSIRASLATANISRAQRHGWRIRSRRYGCLCAPGASPSSGTDQRRGFAAGFSQMGVKGSRGLLFLLKSWSLKAFCWESGLSLIFAFLILWKDLFENQWRIQGQVLTVCGIWLKSWTLRK